MAGVGIKKNEQKEPFDEGVKLVNQNWGRGGKRLLFGCPVRLA